MAIERQIIIDENLGSVDTESVKEIRVDYLVFQDSDGHIEFSSGYKLFLDDKETSCSSLSMSDISMLERKINGDIDSNISDLVDAFEEVNFKHREFWND